MSFGVDTLGGLIEKLKQLVNETQDQYESFFDNTQLFRQGKMDNKEYFTKMGEYLVSSSALNFLTSRIILEIKNVLDKGVSGKNTTGGSAIPASSNNNIGRGFNVDSFVNSQDPSTFSKDYDLPKPQEAPIFKPVDILVSNQDSSNSRKNCIVCAASIPKQAKYCNKCGNSQ